MNQERLRRAWGIGLLVVATALAGCAEDDFDSDSGAPSAEERYQAALTQCQQWAAGTLYPGFSAFYVQDWEAVYASPEFHALVEYCMRDRGYADPLTGP
jgi:hypothetical protein